MSEEKRPIIVKKVKKGGHGGHHGGAWKLAYADLVTAMMAFFLLMWLLGSTTKAQMAGIADYFQSPLKVSMPGGEGSGDSSSVIPGGGMDLTRSTGQVIRGDNERKVKVLNIKPGENDILQAEYKRMMALRAKTEKMIKAEGSSLEPYKEQILVDVTPEGLRIQLIDGKKRAMFDSGHANLLPHTRNILRELGRALNEVPFRISISGHTDATPYSSGDRGYSNWELSADRSNAARREMIIGGLAEHKVLRVVGLASSIPFKIDDPTDASNRRISIIILNKRTEEAITKNSGKLLPNEEPATLASPMTGDIKNSIISSGKDTTINKQRPTMNQDRHNEKDNQEE
ncbi:MAG: flagellar motor protein MotB [Pseudomonadota bacterium]